MGGGRERGKEEQEEEEDEEEEESEGKTEGIEEGKGQDGSWRSQRRKRENINNNTKKISRSQHAGRRRMGSSALYVGLLNLAVRGDIPRRSPPRPPRDSRGSSAVLGLKDVSR